MSEAIIHRNMSFDDYRALPGMNQSTLSKGLRSMAHLRWSMDNRSEPTESMALGTAFHVLTTEPGEFENRYIVGGPVNPKTGKQYGSDTKAFAEWVEQNANGREVITQEDYERADKMASAIKSLPLVDAILNFPRFDTELAIQWRDDGTGILCKCRLDGLANTDPLVILDLKSTRDARPGPFASSIAKYGYHIQAAMYSDAVAEAFGSLPIFLFACVESESPFCSAIYYLSHDAMETGRRLYRSLLASYAECERCGEWPGYATDIQCLELPRWAEVD